MSIFRLHSETGNIWTHLLGFLLFGGLAWMTYTSMESTATPGDHAMIASFFTGALLCLLFSWTFHCVACHSPRVAHIFSRMDYAGIAFLIIGSMYPMLYYAFYCEKCVPSAAACGIAADGPACRAPMRSAARLVYMAVMTLFALATIAVSLLPLFDRPRYRMHRMVIFASVGALGAVPLWHAVVLHGLDHVQRSLALDWLLLMGLGYLSGALLYGLRLPERFLPGKFDLLLHGHQIFHVCVVVSAYFTYRAIIAAVEWHSTHPCPTGA